MSNISQKELLNDSFWTKFQSAKESPLARRLAKPLSLAGSVASVVAPEITEPVKKGVDWLRDTREKGNRAKMNRDEISMEYIMEDGFFPLDNQKITWNNKRNADGTINGTIKVGELIINPKTGEPELGRQFSPDKATYILKFDPKSRTAKRVRGPDRQLATSREDIRDALEDLGYDVIGNIQTAQQKPDGTIVGTVNIRDHTTNAKKSINFKFDTNTGTAQVF